jgi:hypothetical protein
LFLHLQSRFAPIWGNSFASAVKGYRKMGFILAASEAVMALLSDRL